MKQLEEQESPQEKAARKMRIKIAKDVLARLRDPLGGLKPTFGKYVSAPIVVKPTWITRNAQLGPKLVAQPCEVCALGALFVSEVLINDKLGFRQLRDDHQVVERQHLFFRRDLLDRRLEPFFDFETRREIERVFEGHVSVQDLAAFDGRHTDAKSCMLAIMRNIVRNKGAFSITEQRVFMAAKAKRAKAKKKIKAR